MLCPKCGAYSPYNTSVCNRCGAKLTGDGSGDKPRRKKYYRNGRKSEWEQTRDQLITQANDTLDGIMADKTKRIILLAATAAIAIALLAGMIGCVSCVCSSCGSCGSCADKTATVSQSDENPTSSSDSGEALPALPVPSGGDVVSTSDTTSDSASVNNASSTDAPDAGEAPVVSASQLSSSDNSTDQPEPDDADIPADDALVSIEEYIPSLFIDLKYASEDNFTGKVIYDFTEPRLRYGTVKKLAAVQEELVSKGYSLIIWDAYRPLYAQEALWKACPDPAYVSDPTTGYRSHSRGHTVDITLTVIADGSDVVMPSGFDEFSPKADRDYDDVSIEAAANSAMLEEIMVAHGFTGYSGEWWHYSDTDEYPLIEG